MENLDKKSILITGGATGLGFAMAKRFSKKGAFVTICGRRKEKIDEAISNLKVNSIGIVADVTNEEDRDRIINQTIEHGGKIDVLINNAGNMYRGNIDELEESKLIEIFNSNVISGMLLLGKAKQYLKETEGVNIFIGSVHNRRAFPGASPYAATKGALETLTKVLAAE